MEDFIQKIHVDSPNSDQQVFTTFEEQVCRDAVT